MKKKRDGGIGKHKLNEMRALNMKYRKCNKVDKSKRALCSPVEISTWLLIRNVSGALVKKSSTWAFVFFKKF